MTAEDLDPLSTGTELLAALRRRQVSAVEILELYLARISRFNPALNAIILLDSEGAREAARSADAQAGTQARLPLLGLPVTIKDSIDVAGWPTTCGLRRRAGRPAAADAPVVASLRRAGAVIVGKTNVPPYTGDWQTDNLLFGRSNNPWDLGRTPGGSTGGGAAAVATGLSSLELGSDIGGSIRVPASFCGIFGHRPSDTAVPRSGHFPGSALPNAGAMLNVIGPLARSAGDLELVMDVIAGPETGEDVAWRIELPPARHERLADFRIAVLPWLDWVPVDPEIERAQEGLIAGLRRLGATVDTEAPAGLDDLREHERLYQSALGAMFHFSAGFTEEASRDEAEGLLQTGDEFELADAHGFTATARQFLQYHQRREEYRAAYRTFFRDWDILLCPVAPCPAFSHFDPSVSQNERRLAIGEVELPYLRILVYAGVATLSGQPATAFPVGLNAAGLPLGLQAIGPYLEDRTPIRFAALVEREFGRYRPPPGFDDHHS